MSEFREIEQKLVHYAETGYNVLLEGPPGVGKSEMSKQTFNEVFGDQWKYYSAATMDPWTQLIGIPSENKEEGVIDMVRPKWLGTDGKKSVKGIIFDEFNRSKTEVRNAVMELIQFQCINGQPVPDLEVVWACINPADDTNDYDVEPLGEAHRDRFTVQISFPYRPSRPYFEDKYGSDGLQAVRWWNGQPKEARDRMTPRRLDKALEVYADDGSMRDVLPGEANVSKLESQITSTSVQSLDDLQDRPDEEIEAFWHDPNNFHDFRDRLVKRKGRLESFVRFIPVRHIPELINIEGRKGRKSLDVILSQTQKHENLMESLKSVQSAGSANDHRHQKITDWIGRTYHHDDFFVRNRFRSKVFNRTSPSRALWGRVRDLKEVCEDPDSYTQKRKRKLNWMIRNACQAEGMTADQIERTLRAIEAFCSSSTYKTVKQKQNLYRWIERLFLSYIDLSDGSKDWIAENCEKTIARCNDIKESGVWGLM